MTCGKIILINEKDISDNFEFRNLVIQKLFSPKRASSIVARVVPKHVRYLRMTGRRRLLLRQPPCSTVGDSRCCPSASRRSELSPQHTVLRKIRSSWTLSATLFGMLTRPRCPRVLWPTSGRHAKRIHFGITHNWPHDGGGDDGDGRAHRGGEEGPTTGATALGGTTPVVVRSIAAARASTGGTLA